MTGEGSGGGRLRLREPFSAISHMVGAGLSVVALVALLIMARGRVWHVVSFALYGASLIFLYTSSTLYHSLRLSEEHEERLARLDYVGIFVLIVGTYIPVCLVPLRGIWGWSLFGVEVGLGVFGILGILFWRGMWDWLRVTLYVVMGWLALIALRPLRECLSGGGLLWLLAGGLSYTVGTVVFALDKPHLIPGKFSAHDLWHLFVMGGSACHFVLIACYVA